MLFTVFHSRILVIGMSALWCLQISIPAVAGTVTDDAVVGVQDAAVEPDASESVSPAAADDAVNAGEENGEDSSALNGPAASVRQAESMFHEAVQLFENGKNAAAQQKYAAMLVALSSASVDAAAWYGLTQDMSGMFYSLKKSGGGAPRSSGDNSIRLDADNELVKKYLKLYTEGHPKDSIKKALERSGRYRPMIENILAEYDLPRELVYLPIVESLYNVNDLSRAGALGLWQIMPHRARALGLKINYWVDERKDPEKSTRAAARYLKQLYGMFDDWHLALAAYNRGEYGLIRDLKFSNATNIDEMKERQAVPRETQFYVPQFIVCTLIGKEPQKYGFDAVPERALETELVPLDKIVDLKIAAKCAGISVEELRGLNPGLKAWCTPHNYPGFELRVPAGKKEEFLTALSAEKELNPSPGFVKYRVVKGDHLGKIAKKFRTSEAAIRTDNSLRKKYLQIGQILVVRPGRKYFTAN